MDGEDIDDDERCAMSDARTEGIEHVGQAVQPARHESEGAAEEADAEGDGRHEAPTECRGEEMARSREQDGMRCQGEKGQDGDIDDQDHDGHAEGEAVAEI